MPRKRVDDREFPQHTAPSWGRSSVGRAPQWHCGGHQFDSVRLHQNLASAVLLEPFLLSLNEGRVGGGGGDKLSAVYGDGLLAHGNQVTVGANVHALMCDGRGGVAAFIKIIDGKDFEFSVSAHHDGFAV